MALQCIGPQYDNVSGVGPTRKSIVILLELLKRYLYRFFPEMLPGTLEFFPAGVNAFILDVLIIIKFNSQSDIHDGKVKLFFSCFTLDKQRTKQSFIKLQKKSSKFTNRP